MKSNRMTVLAVVLGITLVAGGAFAQSVVRTGGMGHHGGGMGNLLGATGDYLDLTDAQRSEMKAILAKEKPTIRPLMQQLAQSHQQMSQLETAGTFDEAKVRSLATQQSQTMTELMVQKARIKSELMAVLTPDQKTKLATLKARQQARFQKHFPQGSGAAAEATPNQ